MRNQLLLFLFLLIPAALGQTNVDFGLELGVQKWNIRGNEDLFLSQYNQDDGPVLQNFWLSWVDIEGKTRLLDRLRIDASGFGASPNGSVRWQMSRKRGYQLKGSYTRYAHYSALPAFANPFLEQGIVPGQHTLDQKRQLFKLQLELFPHKTLRPFLDLSWNDRRGPSQTTFHVGLDEFRLLSHRNEQENEWVGGLRFERGAIGGEVSQGWRRFEGNGLDQLVADAGDGNSLATVLGNEVSLDNLDRYSRNTAKTPLTHLSFHGAWSKFRLIGAYNYADAESDGSEEESLAGSLVSFQLRRLFAGRTENIQNKTRNPSWRADLKMEADLGGVQLEADFGRRHRQLDGLAMVQTVFLQATPFRGGTAQDISQLLETETSLEKEDDTLRAGLAWRASPNLVFQTGFSISKSDIYAAADVAQIVIEGGQDGDFRRRLEKFNAAVSYRKGKTRLGLDWQSLHADEIVVRTDFIDRDRLKFNSSFDVFSFMSLRASARWTQNENPLPEISYKSEEKQYDFDLDIHPNESINLLLNYGYYESDSRISQRMPQDFSLQTSLYREDGAQYGAHLLWKAGRNKLQLNYIGYENTGLLPFDLYQASLRDDIELSEKVSLILTLSRNNYREDEFVSSRFTGESYGVFLNWRP